MLAAPMPANEAERQRSLDQMLLVDTPDEAAFDRITRIAHKLFDVPIALISIIDTNRQWFKSCIGLPVRETGRDISFCGHAIHGNDLFIIADALADERFADNPLVTNEPHIRFYAGQPLSNADGFNVGTLCIIDRKPRQLTGEQKQMLRDLGHWAETTMRLRHLSDSQQRVLRQLYRATSEKMIDPQLQIWDRNGITRILQLELEQRGASGAPLIAAMASLDQYQMLLTQYGQQTADAALLQVTRLLRGVVGEQGVVGRYEQDKLLILRPAATATSIATTGAVLLDSVAGADPLTLDDNRRMTLSLSVGIASLNLSAGNLTCNDVLSVVDQALYTAKRNGGNQVVSNQF